MSARSLSALLLLIGSLVANSAQAQNPLDPFLTPGVPLAGATPLVGATPAKFEMGSSGAGTYSVALVVPPGTAGVVPSLSLVYSSTGGNGLLGMGWGVAGLSAITRCPTALVPDGFIDPVDFDSNDQFCMDGMRLVPFGDGSYRTTIDTFTKVVPSGGTAADPQKFTAFLRDGKIVEYGGTADSRIEAEGRPQALLWATNRSQDRAGNYFTATYGEVNSLGFYAPLRIDYTGNSAAGVSPYNSVRFHYENRSDTSPSFLGGSLMSTPVRLSQIEAYADSTPVRAYALAYQTSPTTSQSRLVSIQECGFGANQAPQCLPPTSVTLQDGLLGFDPRTTWLAANAGPGGVPVFSSSGRQYVGDFNGDGRQDLLWTYNGLNVALSNGTAFSPVTRWLADNAGPGGSQPYPSDARYVVIGDFNGDGRTDYMWRANNAWYVALSTGTSFTAPTKWISANSGPGGIPVINDEGNKHFAGDFNGDGRTDYMWANSNKMNVALSVGNTFAASTTWLGANAAPGGGPSYPTDGRYMVIADLNGDGRTDYMWRNNEAWHVALSDGNAFLPATTWLPANSGPGGIPVVNNDGDKHTSVDLNGDGMSDFLWALSGGVHVALSNGTGFEPATTWLAANSAPGGGPSYPSDGRFMLFGDYNGDGRIDYMWRNNNAWHVALSKGNAFATPTTWIAANSGPGGIPVINDSAEEFVADFSGDGRADFMWKRNDAWHVAKNTSPSPDLLSRMVDGVGAETQLFYAPLTNPNLYQKSTGAVYPEVDVQPPVQAVSQARVSNGIGGLTNRYFEYTGLRQHVQRRTDLGFASMAELDQARGTVTTSFYNQQFPLNGTERLLEMRAAGGQLRMRITNTYSSVSNPAGTLNRYFVQQKTEEFFELSSSLIVSRTTTQQVDSFNNPTLVTSTASDAYGKTTTTTYTNDSTNWLLGLPTQVQVTGSAPGVPQITRTIANTFDATTGLLTLERTEPGTSLEVSRTFTRDPYGNATSVATSGAGIPTRTETTGYDNRGRFPTSASNALGHSETRSVDARFGAPLSVTGPNALTTTFTYDSLGRPLTRTSPDGTVDALVLETCIAAPVVCPSVGVSSVGILRDGSPPQYVISDSLGREVRRSTLAFDGQTKRTDIEYDALGRVARQSLPYFAGGTVPWITFTYDDLDRPIVQTKPDGSVLSSVYTGLSTQTTNNLNQIQTVTKNSQDQPVSVTDALNHSTTYVYDAFGNPLSVVDPQGNGVTGTFDRLGRRLTLDDPDLGVTSTVYDVLGEAVQQTDAKSQVQTLSYDLLGRVTQRTEVGSQTTFTYDTGPHGIGKLASSAGTQGSASFSKSFSYDAFGRPSSITTSVDGRTYVTTTQYDSLGRVSGLVYPGGFATRSLYNANGYLARVEDPTTSAAYWIAEAQSAAGQSTQELLGNALRTRRTFDPLTLRLTQLQTGPGSTSTTQNLSYSWDTLGNLTQRADQNQSRTETFTYDPLNRMTASQVNGAAAFSYSYDAVGNLLSKSDIGTYVYGAGPAGPHAVTSTTGPLTRTYTYDGNGNQLERRDSGGILVGSFSYTAFDKPDFISATSPTGLNVAQFRYDDQRNLLVRQDTDTQTGISSTTYYVDGLFEETLLPASVTEKRFFVRSDTQVVAVFTDRSTGPDTLRYLHRDHLDSVDTITDTGGGVVEKLSFDPFGQRRNANWTSATTPISSELKKGFTGHEQLDHLALIHMGGRVYDPLLGRFTSADPFVQFATSTQGFNRYSYAENNPLAFVDPSGFNTATKFFQFAGRVGKKIGTAFSNPKTYFDLASALVTGIACALAPTTAGTTAPACVAFTNSLYNLGQDFGFAAVYGNDVPKSIQRGQRITAQLQGFKEPSASIVGISSDVPLSGLPGPLDQWADAKSGGTILNVHDDQSQRVPGSEDAIQSALTTRDILEIASVFYGAYEIKGLLEAGYASFRAAGAELTAARAALVATLRTRALQQAGFSTSEAPVILDSNIAARGLAASLRAQGFNVRSVLEIFGRDPGDPAIREFAETIGARVLSADKGSQIGEGFGQLAIRVPGQVGADARSIIRILSEALK